MVSWKILITASCVPFGTRINLNKLCVCWLWSDVLCQNIVFGCRPLPRGPHRLVHIKTFQKSYRVAKHFQCHWPRIDIQRRLKFDSLSFDTILGEKWRIFLIIPRLLVFHCRCEIPTERLPANKWTRIVSRYRVQTLKAVSRLDSSRFE